MKSDASKYNNGVFFGSVTSQRLIEVLEMMDTSGVMSDRLPMSDDRQPTRDALTLWNDDTGCQVTDTTRIPCSDYAPSVVQVRAVSCV